MRERALLFGPAHLVGILTQPDPGVARPGAPAFVFLNSGILHRVGASRIYVRLARALAEDGFTSLRFDFSGVGDSEVRKDAIPVEERFVTETREAMDYVGPVAGTDRFVLGGLCSGADGAFFTSLDDPRVVGLWQIDAFCYRTPGYYRRRYLPKLVDPRAWAHSIKVRMGPDEAEVERDEEQFVKPEYRRIFPPREVVGEGLGTLLDREVELYFFFTGGQEEHYNYAEQHAEAFPELDLDRRARIRYLESCTHMISEIEHQEVFLSDMRAWASQFGVATPEPAAP